MNCQLQILFQLYENVLYAAFLHITFSRLMFESNFIDGKVSCFRCGVVSVLYDKCTFAVVGFFLAWQEKHREKMGK